MTSFWICHCQSKGVPCQLFCLLFSFSFHFDRPKVKGLSLAQLEESVLVGKSSSCPSPGWIPSHKQQSSKLMGNQIHPPPFSADMESGRIEPLKVFLLFVLCFYFVVVCPLHPVLFWREKADPDVLTDFGAPALSYFCKAFRHATQEHAPGCFKDGAAAAF